MTDDLVKFLRERLDEDQAAALRVHQPFRLYVDDDGCIEQPMQVDDPFGPRNGEYEEYADGDDRLPNHHNSWLLMFDPKRVLRDVEAKRQIIDWCLGTIKIADDDYYNITPEIALKLLASVYQDHPDYRANWRP